MEILLRVHDVRTVTLPLPDFGPEECSTESSQEEEEVPNLGNASVICKTATPPREMAGHTGYLTFATKPRD